MPEPFPATAADVTDDFVLEKCDYFTRVQLWPLRKDLNPRLWLANFADTEQRHARYLLNAFLYLSTPLVEQIVVDSFEALSRVIVEPSTDVDAATAAWHAFVDNLRVVIVRGETARPTDSGYLFSRIVRDRLDISDSRIFDVPEALRELRDGLDAPFVFVDDFVGSGNQFIDTWVRQWDLSDGSYSFADVPAGQSTFYYCPTVATTEGLAATRDNCPRVHVEAGHELGPRSSVFHAESLVWPAELRPSARDVIQMASARAGIPDTGGGENDWRGFHELGLTLAFSHGVPDATLPLYWWESETWHPLKKRAHP